MTSVLNVDEIAAKDGTGPVTLTKQVAAKAWVHFNGEASGAAANDSLNLSSMTDNGTSDYTSAWSSNFSNAYYSVTGTTEYETIFTMQDSSSSQTTSGVNYILLTYAGAAVDEEKVCTTNHGDLA